MSEALDDSLPRLLLFDGRERSFAGAVDALAGLGMEVALLDGNESIEPSARDVIAVVVSEPRSDSDDLGRTERIVRHLREVHDVPVLILASTVDDDFLLQEFRPGARTHRARPVGLDCAERVRSILRTGESATLVFGALEIDRQRHVARVKNRPVELTPKEFDLLEFLASFPRRAFSRDELLTSVWRSSGDWQSPATVTEHVRRLRRKIEPQPNRPRWLITVRRVGYRFEP